MTLVSKNDLSLIDLFAVELEIGRERPAHLTELLHCLFLRSIAGHFEFTFAGDRNLNLVTFFKVERVDHSSGQPNRQAIAPFGHLHRILLDLQRHCISLYKSAQPGFGKTIRYFVAVWSKFSS